MTPGEVRELVREDAARARAAEEAVAAAALRVHACDGEYGDGAQAHTLCLCGWGYPDAPAEDHAAHQAAAILADLREHWRR